MGTLEQEAKRGCVGDLITWRTPCNGIGEGEIIGHMHDDWWLVEPYGSNNALSVHDDNIVEITKPSPKRDRNQGSGVMLYAIKFGAKWGMVRNRRKAIKLAKANGGQVWTRENIPGISAWDWPTFHIDATRIY